MGGVYNGMAVSTTHMLVKNTLISMCYGFCEWTRFNSWLGFITGWAFNDRVMIP